MKFTNKHIVVTGGAGLIGSFLVERLVAAGARVVVADDFSKGRHNHLAGVQSRIEIREGDLEKPDAMDRALAGADIVFHLASRVYGIGYSSSHHLALLDHNERITNNLVCSLAGRRIEHLLIASSSCVYSDDGPTPTPELPLFTGEPEAANSGYGWAKQFLEAKAGLLARERGVPLTIVRPFNIYGERYAWLGDASQAIPMLVKKVMEDDTVVIWGSGEQRRNYMHAVDCAEIIAGLVESDVTGPVNIGVHETVTLRELVDTICRVAERRPKIVADKSKPEGRSVKATNTTRLRAAIPDFQPCVGLEAGLARMLGWYRAAFSGKQVA